MPDPREESTQQRSGPLSDLRIIAVEQFGAGPFGSLYLAGLGADVIKIEDPGAGGDVARRVPPGVSGEASLYFETFNRGKRSLALDLKNPAGRDVFDRLMAKSDIVFNNLRGDLPDKLGLTYARLGSINPAIVCASLSAYGRTGERNTEPGYDALMQAEAGWAAMTGEPGGVPVKSGLSMVDYAAGLTAALGMLAAVHAARRTGKGGDVDTSLYDTAISLLTYPATWWLSAGMPFDRQPMSAHPSIVPFQFFQTADGYVAVACAKEHFWEQLVAELGDPLLSDDPRFETFEGRFRHRDDVLTLLNGHFAQGTSSEWLVRLGGKIPISPVRSMEAALDVRELRATEMLTEYEHPELGAVKTVGLPLRIDGERPRSGRGPALGEDRERILSEVGFDSAAQAELA